MVAVLSLISGNGKGKVIRAAKSQQLATKSDFNKCSGVTRALIGGGCIFIYSCSARRISFEIKFISKEIRRAEHEYMNIHPPN